jgi:hypothetical protein
MGDGSGSGGTAGDFSIAGGSSTTYKFKIASTGAATFSSSVGVGGVSFSSSRGSNGVSLYGSYPAITLESTGVARKWDITANYASGTAFLEFYDETAAAARMVITSGGNVGIGESSPASKLSIGGVQGSTIGSNVALLVGNSGAAGVVGNMIQIGLHYNPAGATPASIIGAVFTSSASFTKSDIFFATRDVTTDTAPTERMRITSGGVVTINQTNSTYGILAVKANSTTNYGGIVVYANGNNNWLNFTHNNTDGVITTDYGAGGSYTGIAFQTTAITRMYIAAGGVVTISNLAGATSSRAVLADTSGSLSAPVSDISVKKNIKSIGYGLNEILKMNPVWFDFIDEYKNYGIGRQNGNIAQEMEKIIPEAVFTTSSTNKMGIEYSQLHAVYIKAFQEQQAQIEELKNKLNNVI